MSWNKSILDELNAVSRYTGYIVNLFKINHFDPRDGIRKVGRLEKLQ